MFLFFLLGVAEQSYLPSWAANSIVFATASYHELLRAQMLDDDDGCGGGGKRKTCKLFLLDWN